MATLTGIEFLLAVFAMYLAALVRFMGDIPRTPRVELYFPLLRNR